MMDLKTAKELAHVKAWLDRMATIVRSGKDAYLTDIILQEAGDSLMMKLGEAANRLSRLDVLAPDVDFRAMTPNRFWESRSAREVVEEIEGIGAVVAQKLAAAGIKTTDALLERSDRDRDSDSDEVHRVSSEVRGVPRRP